LKNIKEKMEEENEKNKEQRLENRTFLQKRNLKRGIMLRSKKVDLVYFILFFIFILFLILFLIFLFLEQLGLGLTGHAVTSVAI